MQTLNFVLPIENETWDIDDVGDADWSSVGFEFNWTRYTVNNGGYSSLFGLTVGYVSGDMEPEKSDMSVEMGGFDFNLKFGWGMAPIAGDVTVAMHILMGFDFKFVSNDDVSGYSDDDDSYYYDYGSKVDYEFSAFCMDMMLGGDLIVAFKLAESIGLVVGIDVTTNLFGIGFLSVDAGNSDDSWSIDYEFSGINIVPHVGVAFGF